MKFFGKRMSKVFKSKQRSGLEVVIHNTKYGEGIDRAAVQNSALGEEIKRAVGDAPQKHGSDEKEKSNGGNRRFHRNERTRDVPVPPCCQVASKYHSLN